MLRHTLHLSTLGMQGASLYMYSVVMPEACMTLMGCGAQAAITPKWTPDMNLWKAWVKHLKQQAPMLDIGKVSSCNVVSNFMVLRPPALNSLILLHGPLGLQGIAS